MTTYEVELKRQILEDLSLSVIFHSYSNTWKSGRAKWIFNQLNDGEMSVQLAYEYAMML